MNTMSTKYPFPATAPASGAQTTLLSVTGKQAIDARRIILMLKTSHDSGTNGLSFQALLDNGGTTFREFVAYTHSAVDPSSTYRVACPVGCSGLKVLYTNSANVLTAWEGSIAILSDEIAAP